MFVDYIIARSSELPPIGPNLYEYVIAANGIFVRASRPEVDAMIWVAATRTPIRGLVEVQPYVRLIAPVRTVALAKLFEMAYRAGNKEILFYLSYGVRKTFIDTLFNPWIISLPEQVQEGMSVHPVDPFAGGNWTAIEVHSHHDMDAFFSSTDNQEEKVGFRIYSVIGGLSSRPQILTRVGIYGHFMTIPSRWVFDLPEAVADAREIKYAIH